MAASSTLFIVCLLGCDLISMWVVVLFDGSTTDAPMVGLPFIWDPFVHMKFVGVHAALNCCMEVLPIRRGDGGCVG